MDSTQSSICTVVQVTELCSSDLFCLSKSPKSVIAASPFTKLICSYSLSNFLTQKLKTKNFTSSDESINDNLI